MQLLPGERIVYQSSGKTLCVTTHRVRQEHHGDGAGMIKSIMLEEVASCAMARETHPWLLVFAALCVVGGLIGTVMAGAVAFVIGLVVGLMLGAVFLLSRKQVIAIASAGTTISADVNAWTVATVHELFDHVEAAKNDRILLVCPAKRLP